MRVQTRRFVAIAAVATLALSACSSGATTAPSAASSTEASMAASAAPSVAPSAAAGLPYTTTLKDGSTFTLAPRIADKVKAKQSINYVLSYQGPGVPLFSQQYQAGFTNSLPEAQAIYPMSGQLIGPVSASGIDPAGQIAQIEALFNTNKIDCISIEPVETNSFTKEIDKLMAAGIPVFTVGITSDANEFTNFTQVPALEGKQAADIVLQWMKDNNKDLKVFAVSSGDPGSSWGGGRIKSFYDEIMANIPDAKFESTPDNALTIPYDATQSYNTAKAFISGHPDIQFIMNADISAENIDRAIKDSGNEGKIFTIGWNVSYGQLDAIASGIQVAAMDQRWDQQAGFGALACANLFATGTILPNTQQLLPVTKVNMADARKTLDAILGGPSAKP